MITKRDLFRSAALAALSVTATKSFPLHAQTSAKWPNVFEAKAIAEEGFTFGLPLVMNYAVMQEFAVDKNSGQFKAPFNEINNEHRVATPADTAVITPNSDTPYSMLWLDLRAEPMVISVPLIERDRYYSVQFIDGNTYNYGYIGTRATGTEPGDYLVVGPDWKGGTPAGIKKVFSSTTPFSLTLFRTQLFKPDDISNVEKIQAGYKVQPLSAYLKQPAQEGDDKVDKFLASGMKNINGWNVGAFFGDRAFYNGNWLMRAGAAKGGLYGNDAVEAMYPYTRSDATGEPLDGSKFNYTITFPAGELPPANAFWSVTMYDGKSQLLIKNPINRYLINAPMLPEMKKNADGSLTLYVQKDSPGADKEANWLPAPNDKIYLVLRLYWPKPAPPSILPAGEGTWKPPGVKKVS